MSAIEKLLKENIRLPSPPAIAVRILETVKKDEASFHELANIIQSDPALTARILKVANCSFYSLPFKVDSIEKAIKVLGVEALKNIALSFIVTEKMKGHEEGGFDFDYFWKRSITAAVGADLIATLMKRKSDDTFVTALLQDIGIVIMYLGWSGDYLKVINNKISSDRPIADIEREIFGFDHQELGAEVLKSWGLPENIYLPIRYHHSSGYIPEEYKVQSDILMLANNLSSVYHGSKSAERIIKIKDTLCKRYGNTDSDVDSLIDAVADKAIEVLSSFDIPPGKLKPFSQILQEANEELSNMNLSYEFLMIELKQSKEVAEKLARELKEANVKLREMAFRDELTGLYNRRYFQELMEMELERSQRYQRQFSFIIFDIDFFKKVNDTYGHPVGDVVLKQIAAKAHLTTRECDMIARYGGEEFAVVLPETDTKGAVVLAERLRLAIEQLEIIADGKSIKTTISAGVTTYLPAKEEIDKSVVIYAADRALYNSKRTGRNKVSFMSL